MDMFDVAWEELTALYNVYWQNIVIPAFTEFNWLGFAIWMFLTISILCIVELMLIIPFRRFIMKLKGTTSMPALTREEYIKAKRARRQFAHVVLEEIISEGLEIAGDKDILSREEIAQLYLDCGKRFRMPDLLPKQIVASNVEELKKCMRLRIARLKKDLPNIPNPDVPVKRSFADFVRRPATIK